MCLAHSAGVVPTSQSLADMQDHAPAIGRYIRALMSSSQATASSSNKSGETNPVQIYTGLLQQLLAGVGGKKPIILRKNIKTSKQKVNLPFSSVFAHLAQWVGSKLMVTQMILVKLWASK